ncbi:MAG: hypothetical protein WCP21_16810, partial [Armatimonadota bacterium]
LEEIMHRTGLRFPAGTVLVGSYYDGIGMGIQYGARLHVPRQGFAQLLNSVPRDREIARGGESNVDMNDLPETFFGKTWWTPAQMHFSLRLEFLYYSNGVLLGVDETHPKYVDVLLHVQVL